MHPTRDNVQLVLHQYNLKWKPLVENDDPFNIQHVVFNKFVGTVPAAINAFNELWHKYYFPKRGGNDFKFGKGYIIYFEVFELDFAQIVPIGDPIGSVSRLVTHPDDLVMHHVISGGDTYWVSKNRWILETFNLSDDAVLVTTPGAIFGFTAYIQEVSSRRFISPQQHMSLEKARQVVRQKWTETLETNRPQNCYIVVQAWQRIQINGRSKAYMTGFQYKKLVNRTDFDAEKWHTQRNNEYALMEIDKTFKIEVKLLSAERGMKDLKVPLNHLSFSGEFQQILPMAEDGVEGDNDRMISDYGTDASGMSDADALLLLCI